MYKMKTNKQNCFLLQEMIFSTEIIKGDKNAYFHYPDRVFEFFKTKNIIADLWMIKHFLYSVFYPSGHNLLRNTS